MRDVISVPLAYFSGIGAASRQGVLIKGGKYLEALATAKNFVFDKTGTLTTGKLRVAKTVSLSDFSEDEILSLAAAVEEYSSHPIARAICREAKAADINLDNFSETAGRGTSAQYEGETLFCGSYRDKVPSNAADCNVFLTLDGELIGAIQVADTVRRESAEVITQLKSLGIQNTVMEVARRRCMLCRRRYQRRACTYSERLRCGDGSGQRGGD